MTDREQYAPVRPAARRYEKAKERSGRSFSSENCVTRRKRCGWRLLIRRHLREWAPFEADGSLGTVGSVVCFGS